MTTDTATPTRPRARYTRDQIVAVKRKLSTAQRITQLAPGEARRIAAETGVDLATVVAVVKGERHRSVTVEPAHTHAHRELAR